MDPGWIAVVAASLAGSLHCVGMCGPFAAMAVGAGGEAGGRTLRQLTYNGGRLLSYLLLGAAAGAAGSFVDDAGTLLGIQRAAAIGSGVVIALWGAALLLQSTGWLPRRAATPSPWSGRLRPLFKRFMAAPPALRAGLLGLLTTLLPCGWLYAFVVAAAGTGSAIGGTAVMVAFWLGTVPAMVGMGAGAMALLGRLRRHAPVLTATMLLVMGVSSVAWRITGPHHGAHGGQGAPSAVEVDHQHHP